MIEAEEKNWKSNQINRKINLFILLNKPLRVFHIAWKNIKLIREKSKKRIFPIHENSRAEDCNGENFNLPRDAAPSSRFNFSHLVPRKKKRPCRYIASLKMSLEWTEHEEPSKDFEKSHRKCQKVVKIISLSSRCRLTGYFRIRVDKKGLTLEITEDKKIQLPQH